MLTPNFQFCWNVLDDNSLQPDSNPWSTYVEKQTLVFGSLWDKNIIMCSYQKRDTQMRVKKGGRENGGKKVHKKSTPIFVQWCERMCHHSHLTKLRKWFYSLLLDLDQGQSIVIVNVCEERLKYFCCSEVNRSIIKLL